LAELDERKWTKRDSRRVARQRYRIKAGSESAPANAETLAARPARL
jgi:hypothetical protein